MKKKTTTRQFLDVEGSEEKILKAIPWEKIDIDFGIFLEMDCFSNKVGNIQLSVAIT